MNGGYEIILPQSCEPLYNEDPIIAHLLKVFVQFDKAFLCIHPKQLRKMKIKLCFTYTCLQTSETRMKNPGVQLDLCINLKK